MSEDLDPTDAIVRTVLTVARLGETDHFGWWGTRSFGAAGRVVLRQRVERTWRMAAIELDVASAANRNNDVIDRRNAAHLFSDNWPVRRWASAWVSEQKTTQPPDEFFDQLETASTEQLLALLPSGVELDSSANATRVGEISADSFDDPAALVGPVRQLAAAYVALGSDFMVPYLEVEA